MTDARALNNILHLLSPLDDAHIHVDVREDYVMETSIGCFKLAYSPATHCMALFYARHPDDLAACDDETGAHGIAHKDHLTLVKMFPVNHDIHAKWNSQDKRQQFELSWVRRDLAAMAHDMPRILFREANLHRIDERTQSSVFVAYKQKPSTLVDGEYSFDIVTKTDDNFRLTGIESPHASASSSPEIRRSLWLKLFRAAGAFLSRRHHINSFPLQSHDPITEENHTSFKKETLADVTAADHAVRLQQIWDGVDPVHWRESKLLPVYRAGNAVRKKLADIGEMTRKDPEEFLRHMGTQATHLFIDGFASVLLSTFIDKVGDFGEKEKRGQVPAEWHKIVSKGSRRLVTIDSALHRNFIHPDPNHFGDLRWVNPDEHLCNFTTENHTLLPIDPARTASNWTKSLFTSPYASAFDYHGEGYVVLSPADSSKVKIMAMQTSHGVMAYYVPETLTLYAYYNQPDYETPDRKLPADAGDYLRAGTVLRFDLKDRKSLMTPMPFEDFQSEMRRGAHAPDLVLPSADAPKKDVMNVLNIQPAFPLPNKDAAVTVKDGPKAA